VLTWRIFRSASTVRRPERARCEAAHAASPIVLTAGSDQRLPSEMPRDDIKTFVMRRAVTGDVKSEFTAGTGISERQPTASVRIAPATALLRLPVTIVTVGTRRLGRRR